MLMDNQSNYKKKREEKKDTKRDRREQRGYEKKMKKWNDKRMKLALNSRDNEVRGWPDIHS